jgi:hypothetical protein
MAKSRKVHRDARDGRFITQKEAKRRPSTTVTETVKESGKSGRGGKRKGK